MRSLSRLMIILALGASGAAGASTRWIITDPDRAKAARTATEQAMQRARAERSCYIPADEKLCRRQDGLWSCSAGNPAKASSCGTRGSWKKALSPT